MKLNYLQFSVFLFFLSTPVQLQESAKNSTSTITPMVNSTQSNRPIIGWVAPFDVPRSIVTVFLLGVPPITIFLHAIMIYLLFISNKRHKYTNIFYKLVLIISLTVMYWASYVFYQGLCQVYGYSVFGETANVIIATIAQYIFYICMNMNLLIAFNRFSAVVLFGIHDRVFSPTNGILFIIGILLLSAVENIPGFIYLMKYYIDSETFNYLYRPSDEFLRMSIFIEMACVYAVHITIFILYIWCFKSYRSIQSTSAMTSQLKKERRLLIQAVISGSPCFVLMTCHHLIHFPFLEILAGELCVGIDPVVYMWFNKDIRVDLLELIGYTNYARRFQSSGQVFPQRQSSKQSGTHAQTVYTIPSEVPPPNAERNDAQ